MNQLDLKDLLSRTMQRILEPVARIAMRGELSHREFVEASKQAFFKAARDDYGISGRKTNLARVAILSGLSRKECSRLKELEDSRELLVSEAMNPCTRVISAWYQRAEYLDEDGTPLVISDRGPAPSLEHLIKVAAGDMPGGAVAKELTRTQVISSAEQGMWRITRRNFIPSVFDKDRVRILGNQLSDLGATINYNLEQSENDKSRLQRYVIHEDVPSDVVEEFQAMATERSQALLEELDLWLAERQRPGESKAEKRTKTASRVGVGVYFFKDR